MIFKPADTMVQALQAKFGVSTTREAMALTLKAHETHLATQIFERGKELLRLLNATAQILLAVDDQQRRAAYFSHR